jgi:hypothetical protein
MFYTVDSVHLPSIRHLNFYIGGKMKINQESSGKMSIGKLEKDH